MTYRKHSFSDKEVSVLHQEAGWFRQEVAEAIYIVKTEPELNRERGQHTLPAIYLELLTSCVQPSFLGHVTSEKHSSH